MSITELLLKRFLNDAFVETGTYRGDAVHLALKVGFKEAYSIEVDDGLYEFCRFRFEHDSRVHLFHGDSAEVLPMVISQLRERATIRLDAHVFHPTHSVPNGATRWPLMRELDVLAKTLGRRDHTILIDDRKVFQSHFGVADEDVREALRRINPSYEVTYEDSDVHKENIVAARLPEDTA
jgi:hypothetical protein